MDREEYFRRIYLMSSSEIEGLVKLLSSRGFLIYENKGRYYLSDNGHASDEKYLDLLLKKYGLGFVDDGEIIIKNSKMVNLFKEELYENIQIGFPSCWQERNWSYFKQRRHGYKVAVSLLEPYVARYIKAISACGVLTVGSCDGNHFSEGQMIIMTEGEGSVPWHKLICEKCLVSKYDIDWVNNYTAMRFSAKTKFYTYYEVNKAAEYLYANRKEIRRIKDTVFSGMSNGYLKHHTSEEIEKEFIVRATELFDSSNL